LKYGSDFRSDYEHKSVLTTVLPNKTANIILKDSIQFLFVVKLAAKKEQIS